MKKKSQKLFKVHCVKCKVEYKDKEPDDYYCPPCNEARLEIAKQVNAKIQNRPKKNTMSGLQQYDQIRKARGVNFVNIKDLGISLN